MRRGLLVVVVVVVVLAGCGGGHEKPDNAELGKISGAYGQLVTHCIGGGLPSGAQGAADTLVAAAKKYGDTKFRLNPNGPEISADQVALRAARSTSNCDPEVTRRLQDAAGG